MTHRIREAMRDDQAGPLGGEGKVIEADETFVGGKAHNRAYRKEHPKKAAVFALVGRGWKVHSTHVDDVTAKTLRPILVQSHLISGAPLG